MTHKYITHVKKCQYYKNVKDSRLKVAFKLREDVVFVHPGQVFSPLVLLSEKMSYQWETINCCVIAYRLLL